MSALELPSLGEQFDTVVDSGLFHVFDDADRKRYVDALKAVLVPGGRCFILCFSDRQPGQMGPRRVREAEIRASFAEGWTVDAVEPSRFALNAEGIERAGLAGDFSGADAQAWRVSLTRI
jgi:cyclopropane fatty-acyl-phospholipid synthase-like methyltransferase